MKILFFFLLMTSSSFSLEIKESDLIKVFYPTSIGLAGAAHTPGCPCNERANGDAKGKSAVNKDGKIDDSASARGF